MDRGAWGLQSTGLQRVGHDWATREQQQQPRQNQCGWRETQSLLRPKPPGSFQMDPNPLSSRTRQKNPYAKPSTNPGQRSVPIPQPLHSIGREGVCELAEAGSEGQPGRQGKWFRQSLKQDMHTWGGNFFFFFFNIWLHQVLVLAHGIFVEACRICLVAAGQMHVRSSSLTRDRT